MPIDDEFLRSMESVGITPEDVLNTLRPNSPLDRVIVTVACTKCLNQESFSLRELHLKQWRCACGADFDAHPFREDFKLLLAGHRGPFASMCFLPDTNESAPES